MFQNNVICSEWMMFRTCTVRCAATEDLELSYAHDLDPITMKFFVYLGILSTCRTPNLATLTLVCTVSLDFNFLGAQNTQCCLFYMNGEHKLNFLS